MTGERTEALRNPSGHEDNGTKTKSRHFAFDPHDLVTWIANGFDTFDELANKNW